MMSKDSWLTYFPITFFSAVMGLSGLTIAWQRAEQLGVIPFRVSPFILGLTVLIFVTILSVYIAKIIRYPDAVKAEIHHPVKLNFFPTISISLILIGTSTLSIAPGLSKIIWGIGTAVQLILTLYVLNMWINRQHYKIEHVNPAWFIPVVGNILVPIAGVPHGFIEVSWFYFSLGLVFWIVLLGIIFNRFIFHPPMPEKLLPTFFILIAPPSIGFLAYFNLTGHLDAFARILYNAGLFFTLMLATQIFRFIKIDFTLSWWAYSFPMAAITVCTLEMNHLLGESWLLGLSLLLLTILTLILCVLVVRTLISIARREICVNDE